MSDDAPRSPAGTLRRVSGGPRHLSPGPAGGVRHRGSVCGGDEEPGHLPAPQGVRIRLAPGSVRLEWRPRRALHRHAPRGHLRSVQGDRPSGADGPDASPRAPHVTSRHQVCGGSPTPTGTPVDHQDVARRPGRLTLRQTGQSLAEYAGHPSNVGSPIDLPRVLPEDMRTSPCGSTSSRHPTRRKAGMQTPSSCCAMLGFSGPDRTAAPSVPEPAVPLVRDVWMRLSVRLVIQRGSLPRFGQGSSARRPRARSTTSSPPSSSRAVELVEYR